MKALITLAIITLAFGILAGCTEDSRVNDRPNRPLVPVVDSCDVDSTLCD